MEEFLKKAFTEQGTELVRVKKWLKVKAEEASKKEEVNLSDWVSLAIAEKLIRDGKTGE